MRGKILALGLPALVVSSLALALTFGGGSPEAAEPFVQETGANLTQTKQLSTARQRLSQDELELAVANDLLPDGVQTLLPVDRAMRHGDFVWDASGAPRKGPLVIHIDLRRQLVSVFRNGHEIGTSVIVYGAPEMETPEGQFKLLSRHRNYVSRKYGSPMPYSLFFTDDGVALHASKMTDRHATHGCVGLPREFARHLFDASSKGDIVEVVRSVEPKV